MDSVPDLKDTLCFERTNEKFHGIRPFISPTFIFQGKKCFLKLWYERPSSTALQYLLPSPSIAIVEVTASSSLYLHMCGVQRLSLPFKIRVFIEKAKSSTRVSFPMKNVEDRSDRFWNCSLAEQRERFKMDGNEIDYLCFRIMIYKESQIKMENKCLRIGLHLNSDKLAENLSKDFSELLDSGLNHDAELKCGKHSVEVHKVVLSARSEVFKVMLQSDMREGRTGIIEIKDMDGKYFHDFIRYLYTDIMPELTLERAIIFYEAGDKYDIKSLVLRCSEYLHDNITPENAVDCFALADRHSDEKLKSKIINYMLEKEIYLRHKYWLPFCDSFPKAAKEVYSLSYKNH